jgi:hypothetical protein
MTFKRFPCSGGPAEGKTGCGCLVRCCLWGGPKRPQDPQAKDRWTVTGSDCPAQACRPQSGHACQGADRRGRNWRASDPSGTGGRELHLCKGRAGPGLLQGPCPDNDQT